LNLVADIGNSRSKIVIFSGKEMVESFAFDELSINTLKDLRERFPAIENGILSTVSDPDPAIVDYFKSAFSFFLELSPRTPVPIRNNYLTPDTLGRDRLAAAIGALELFPGKDLLVIDAGTAVTFDLIEGNGTFAGGNISPGLRSRFRALHEFTSKLPLTKETETCPALGLTTDDAIRAGVINGMLYEIDGTIDTFKKKLPGLQPVLTGGDALFFERRLKNPIFVKSEITLIGLNRILEYNVEK
jgi:type III pantothenate kinase